MRVWLSLLLVLLTAGPLAHAQTSPAEPSGSSPASAPALNACTTQSECSGATTCFNGACVPDDQVPGGFKGFYERLTLTIGLGTFGEIFPYSSQKIPGSSRGQFNLMGGVRFALGTRLPKRFRVMVVIEAGYANAGYFPNRAADGVAEGVGLEVSVDYWPNIKPFIRFMYDAVVFPVRTSSEGTLANNAYFVSLGARYGFVELHLSVGRDFAGGVAPGIGFGLSWLY